MNDFKIVSLVCFSDVSFTNLKWDDSQDELLVLLLRRNGKYMLSLAWQSKKLKKVVKCTLTAETLASEGANELAITIKTLLLKILNIEMQNQTLPIN